MERRLATNTQKCGYEIQPVITRYLSPHRDFSPSHDRCRGFPWMEEGRLNQPVRCRNDLLAKNSVETTGIEPATSWLQFKSFRISQSVFSIRTYVWFGVKDRRSCVRQCRFLPICGNSPLSLLSLFGNSGWS
jgi:hypothetical protein